MYYRAFETMNRKMKCDLGSKCKHSQGYGVYCTYDRKKEVRLSKSDKQKGGKYASTEGYY